MTKKYILIIKKQRKDGTYSLVYLDYKFSIEETNKIIKKAEKLLKEKNKKEGGRHSVLEEKIVEDLIEIIQIVL